MKWKNIDGMPKEIGAKIDMSKLKNFHGECEMNIIVTNKDAILKNMTLTYPWHFGTREMSIDIPPQKELDRILYP